MKTSSIASWNVAINFQGESIVRQANKVHLQLNTFYFYLGTNNEILQSSLSERLQVYVCEYKISNLWIMFIWQVHIIREKNMDGQLDHI